MRSNYNTRQRQIILDALKQNAGVHMSAAAISDYLKSSGYDIGIATIYRQLARLTDQGVIQRFSMDGSHTAYYEYMSETGGCNTHFHFKCEKCEKLIHFECDSLRKLQRHLTAEHGFDINSMRTVFYGICNECAGKPQNNILKHPRTNKAILRLRHKKG